MVVERGGILWLLYAMQEAYLLALAFPQQDCGIAGTQQQGLSLRDLVVAMVLVPDVARSTTQRAYAVLHQLTVGCLNL